MTQHNDLSDILEEVRRIELVSLRLVSDVMSGGYASVFKGSGVEFSEVREYVEGDDPRSVDWNVSARLGRPFVKKYVDERELTVLFVVDLSRSMSGGTGAWSGRQAAARVCACLGLAAVRNNDKVGLVTFTSRMQSYVVPARGMGHALRIVRDVLALPGQEGRTSMAEALDFVARVPRRHAVVFVVSDFLHEGWEEALRFCALRHDLTAVRLRFPELEGLALKRTILVDPESGSRRLMNWGRRACLEEYRNRARATLEATEHRLRQLKVDLVDMHLPRTPDIKAFLNPWLVYFRQRQMRGARE